MQRAVVGRARDQRSTINDPIGANWKTNRESVPILVLRAKLLDSAFCQLRTAFTCSCFGGTAVRVGAAVYASQVEGSTSAFLGVRFPLSSNQLEPQRYFNKPARPPKC